MVAPSDDPSETNGSLVRGGNRGHKVSIELGEPVRWFQDEITRFVQGERYLLAASAGCGKSLFLSQLGIALAPLTARLVAELATGQRPSLDLAPLRPDRFT